MGNSGFEMKNVENGDFVKICYVGRLENGAIFEQTGVCRSVEIRVGAAETVEGLESALIGMTSGERRRITLTPDEAFGERDEQLDRSIPRSLFSPGYEPKEGDFVAVRALSGEMVPARVIRVEEDYVRVDFNHPLAGKTLVYDLEVAEVNEKPSPSLSLCGVSCCCYRFHTRKSNSPR